MSDIKITSGDMPEPRFSREGYDYLGEDEKWHIRDNAPDWAKKEFEEYMAMVNPVPDEEEIIVQR